MKVLKFGGSSISDSARIKHVAEIIYSQSHHHKLTIVVSAFGGITDRLILAGLLASEGKNEYRHELAKIEEFHLQCARDLLNPEDYQDALIQLKYKFQELSNVLQGVYLLKEQTLRSADLISSFGERLSGFILSLVIKSKGLESVYVDARELIKTDNIYGHATVNFLETNARIKAYFEHEPNLPVVTGFIASAPDNTTTTLGRGGSDYTASILAGALEAEEIQIWTDVHGMMSADPKKVNDAYTLREISYGEALELSHAGARILHPYTVRPAIENKIPIYIKNTFDPENPGTRISEKITPIESFGSVKGISSINEVVLVNVEGSGMVGIPGIASRLFSSLAKAGINIIFISQASSEQSISLVVRKQAAEKAKAVVEAEFAQELAEHVVEKISIRFDMAIIAIVGDKMAGRPGVSARLFETLGKNGVNVNAVAQGSNEMNISIVVQDHEEDKALNCIHESFFLSRNKIHLFVAGTGTIAKSLLSQIAGHREVLNREMNLEIEVCGLTNTRERALDPNGIDLDRWQDALKQNPDAKDINSYVQQIRDYNLHNTIFVDCTASGHVARLYPKLLTSNISVVTANKLGTAGDLSLYESITEAVNAGRAKFLYETNVGAGLPILGTLADLRRSGDKIEKIEGVVSGTLSYIFTTLRSGQPFSEIIRQAKQSGYTEPDPREDLSGSDFARKFLILARDLGYKLNFKDIEYENLVPEALRGEMDTETFLDKLKEFDADFETRQQEAKSNQEVLCYLGRLENGKIHIGLSAVPDTSPIATLTGTENLISFTTERYKANPLIVRGPGAGAEVTAGGVFADILRLSNYLT
jgi:aspartokinase/homoserine dehydrogenase 1